MPDLGFGERFCFASRARSVKNMSDHTELPPFECPSVAGKIDTEHQASFRDLGTTSALAEYQTDQFI